MPRFSATVTDAEQVTHDVLKVRLSVPGEVTYLPGQYFQVFLAENFDTSLSACCAPTPGVLEFSKKNTGSEYSKRFFSLKKGDVITVDGPFGRFVLVDNQNTKVFLSGGIGVTPLRSMLQHAARQKNQQTIHFIYANKTPEDIAFRKELEGISAGNPGIKFVNVISRPEESKEEWKGLTGHIDAGLIKKLVPDYGQAAYYICGPPKMVEAMKQAVQELGVPKEQVKSEDFTGY